MKRLTAVTLAALLIAGNAASAQTTTPAPSAPPAASSAVPPAAMPEMQMPMAPKKSMGMMTAEMSGESYKVPLGELAAIGAGVVVGAAFAHAVAGHGLMLIGAAAGGYIGDWWYGTAPQRMAAK